MSAIEDELSAARAWVLAELDRFGQHGGASLRPAELSAALPLREPSAGVSGTLAARSAAGLSADGAGSPRVKVALAGIALLLVFAVVGAVLLPGALALVPPVLAVLLGGALAGYAAVDPLRLAAGQRRELDASRRWTSTQPWIGPHADSRERRLVLVATSIADRVVRSPMWASVDLADHRVRLDLAAELDEIDRRAYQLAEVRGGVHRRASGGGVDY
ncbi:MAG: hypothetical protein J2O49_08390, partial [Sciscionella sp.]|nr:hypothetical protein [Sciscionella sp.]